MVANEKIEWVCPGCEAPNVIIPERGKQYSLTCCECGTPSVPSTVSGRIPRMDWENLTISTCYTPAHIDYMRIEDA